MSVSDKVIAAIRAKDCDAYNIIHTGGNYYSARVRGMIAYYEVVGDKIIGDVWYE